MGTIVGVLVLILLSAVPILGEIIAPVASLAGGGALALVIWERFRGTNEAAAEPAGAED